MEKFFKKGIMEVTDSSDTEYVLERNDVFYDTGFKIMQNPENKDMLKCYRYKYNGKIKLVYFTNEFITVEHLIKKTDVKLIGNIICKIIDAFINIENIGFLNLEYVINSLNKVYINKSTNTVQIIYIPVSIYGETKSRDVFEEDVKKEFRRLLENIILADNPIIKNMINCFNDNSLDLKEIGKRILNLRNEKNINNTIEYKIQADEGILQNETICLKSVNGMISFEINGHDYIIGKKREMVDGVIIGNSAVSRVHCKILCRNGYYFIADMGSSNGTFLDGMRVTADNPQQIHLGSRITIADIEFVVRRRQV